MSLELAIDLFNRGEFYACHDVPEDLRVNETGEIRELYQGILQISVAMYHYSNADRNSAASLVRKGICHLEPFDPDALGINMKSRITDCRGILQKLEQGDDAHCMPAIRWSISPH